MANVALLVMTDGRFDLLERTIQSIDNLLVGHIAVRLINCDTGNPAHGGYLQACYPGWTVDASDHRRGYTGAVRHCWDTLGDDYGITHIVHWEDDFRLLRPFDVVAACAALDRNPHLAQMALRRQAWYPGEMDVGGIVESNPTAFTEVRDGYGVAWLEHRLWFTANPSIYRRTLLDVGWPDCDQSEEAFTARLLEHGTPEVCASAVRFGYWGDRASGVWVQHIGAVRAGTGY